MAYKLVHMQGDYMPNYTDVSPRYVSRVFQIHEKYGMIIAKGL